ncbi:MAG: ATP-dependent metallopeptidase FtsH/Yme1/Tma family protein [Clostridiales bacterium]|jgi:cell division protease FtsH|nr:ATP-dependent metallopeptidase FtsH/Yme1/Tma family protein [Clostridiales bacterium]
MFNLNGKSGKRGLRFCILAGSVAALLAAAYFNAASAVARVPYTEFMGWLESGRVESAEISGGGALSFTLSGDSRKYKTDDPRSEDFKRTLLERGVAVREGARYSQLLAGGAMFAAFFLFSRRNGQGSMGISLRDGSETAGCDFSSVAGSEEAKEAVADIVNFIREPEKYARIGAKLPKGVIFCGPPGTGKTLLARAVAGEAGVPFYAVSGSDFVQMYVGVGAGRIRELFKKARESKKAVIFIDEIDALGKKRTNAPNGGNDEREQTLNALLTEMSGFKEDCGVVVIAATNRPDTLDEALLRPGRFDRRVEVGLPDLSARRKILELCAAGKKIAGDVDFERLAKSTVYFSGAKLAGLMNEAGIIAANRGGESITGEDVEKAYYTVVAGSPKKDLSGLREADRRVTAFHEAGHALACKLLLPENSVLKITVVPSSRGAGGFCVNVPPDRAYRTKSELRRSVMVSCAGRAAEELVFGADNITTGAAADIETISEIIRDMVSVCGMGEAGLINAEIIDGAGAGDRIYSECAALAGELYKEVTELLRRNMDKLTALAEELIERESLGEEDVDRLTAG